MHMCMHICVYVCAADAKSLQSCPTLCDPMEGSPPGSSVFGIFQARVLEWGAIAFSSVCLCVCVCVYVCVCVCIYIYVGMYACVYVCMYIYTCISSVGHSSFILFFCVCVCASSFLFSTSTLTSNCCPCSVAKLWPTLCDLMDSSTPSSSVLH